uniref:Complement system-related protein CFH1-1 n=1 Tax=Cyprinus carpio TaxID=7962 RepID=A0A5Q2UCE2_CYPCA|nr:complement system-related protein CFH1-1 [Cyprinus carpio]
MCLRENIKYADIVPVGKASYADGETVKVNCVAGYTGLYKLKCEKGEWKKSIERPCAKKKCGHPGDTQNGDFKLTEGTEFVFGATVVYTCKKGYEMASRINQRTCRTQGWDNAVPVCEECLREDIKYENTEQVAKASYDDGETVRVNCMTGYTGLYKLKCEKGEWKKSIERPCAKRKCSHPGDTPNGNFELKEGTEFVFGATVVYTCVKGYEMTSRINQRTCRAKGWDNAVPVCEVVKCPAIITDGEVTASGNTEEGRYGDVIHFECVSSDKMIDGSSDIHCKETGKWSDVVPKCKDITCIAPVIANGYVVEQRSEYQKDATLKYKCNKRFKPREGIPRCAKFGWTLKPECDEMPKLCLKLVLENGFIYIHPSNKEEIFYSCKTGYKPFTGNWWDSVTCRKGSQFDEPRCIRKEECGALPSVHHGKLTLTLHDPETADVECDPGYMSTDRSIKCTNGRWEKPVCKGQTTSCGPPPDVNNADPIGLKTEEYKTGERVEYSCFNKYTLDLRPPFSSYLTCEQGEWRGNIKCLSQTTSCGPPPHVEDADTIKLKKDEYNTRERVEYSCFNKYTLDLRPPFSKYLTCVQGEWRGNI